jgi:hypothetical protein
LFIYKKSIKPTAINLQENSRDVLISEPDERRRKAQHWRETMTTTQARDSRKNKRSPMIRVPEAMKARIEKIRDEMVASYEAGRGDLPSDVDCDNVPLWAAIAKALDELDDHKRRSRKSRKNSKTAIVQD